MINLQDAAYGNNIFNYKCQNHFENCYSNSNLTSSFSHTLMHFIAFLVLVRRPLCEVPKSGYMINQLKMQLPRHTFHLRKSYTNYGQVSEI